MISVGIIVNWLSDRESSLRFLKLPISFGISFNLLLCNVSSLNFVKYKIFCT